MPRPTEDDIVRYENRIARRWARRQRRQPIVRTFFGYLFGLVGLGIVGVVLGLVLASNLTSDGQKYSGSYFTPHDFLSGWTGFGLACYVGVICLIWLEFHSTGHRVRTIARARRASAIGDEHPWRQFRTIHPYWSHVFIIFFLFQLMSLAGGRKRR